jgi:hypothetical protein
MALIPSGRTGLCVRLPSSISPTKLLESARRICNVSDGNCYTRPLGMPLHDFQWHTVSEVLTSLHPWDSAHALSRSMQQFGIPALYAEPDFIQSFPFGPSLLRPGEPLTWDPNWPPNELDGAPWDWHLYKSKLKEARDSLGVVQGNVVRVGHLDTGYSNRHETKPRNLRTDLAVNLVEGGTNAVDPAEDQPLSNLLFPGHGTLTIALLAGGHCSITNNDLGGAPFAEVVPIRLANSVVQFASSAIHDAILRAVGLGCHVITLSMGGLPCQSWAAAVNNAYDAGCTICAAAGSNMGGFPTHDTVWPAKFKRVVAVCGATHSGTIYFDPRYNGRFWMIEGNFGPDSGDIMEHQIAAYVPNVLKAMLSTDLNDHSAYTIDGNAGTSGATPQVAAAAALYFQKYFDILVQLDGWKRVEAVRNALFVRADPADEKFFGRGYLNAECALREPVNTTLPKTSEDEVSFLPLTQMSGWENLAGEHQLMFATEAAQITHSYSKLAELFQVNLPSASLSNRVIKQITDLLLSSSGTSMELRKFLQAARKKM